MLYLHIPFCAQRCIYCDFYTTTKGEEVRKEYISSLCAEIKYRAGELPHNHLSTIYLGGGTPSLLSEEELIAIFDSIREVFTFDEATEITIESNPDDITADYLTMLRRLGFNRLSMGVQSFQTDQLSFLRRRHTAEQALTAVALAYEKGFENISIDLIYGLPHQQLSDWEKDLRTAFSLPITHLSAYSLIYEKGTPLYKMKKMGKVKEAEEGLSFAMYERLLHITHQAGWEHYEISNFAQPHYRSQHNSGYWKDRPYLGCGTAAHSFNGSERRWNISSLQAYIASPGQPPHHIEKLTPSERLNDRLLTSLRTVEGLSLEKTTADFGEMKVQQILHTAAQHIQRGNMLHDKGYLKLSQAGFFISDDIISDLMEV